jgi:phospholipid/cholesterol/gamma-HCH transport system substrate-binding protein
MFVLWLTQSTLQTPQTLYDIYFKGSVAGLKVGSSVQYRGIPIGTVKNLGISPKNVEKVKVIVSIDSSTVIKADTIASLESQGLTGLSNIQIRGGSKESPVLKAKPDEPNPVIPSKSSFVEELTASLPELVDQASKLTQEIKALFDAENRDAFTKTIHNIERITEFLAPSTGAKESVLKDMGKTMDTFWETLAEFKNMSKELKTMLQENRQSVRSFSSVGLNSFNKLLSEGHETLTSLRRVTNSLERSPSRFFHNDPNQGVPTK